MPLASSAVAAAVSWAASGARAGAREPATRDGIAGASRGMPRSRIRHERWVSSARGPSTAFRAVRGDEDDPGSLDENDPPLSPARAAADPRRPSRDSRSPVEPGPSYYARPSRADVERQSSSRREKAKAPNGRRRRSRKGDVATLADGAEVFLITTAVGVTAMRASERADLDARRERARDRLRLATAAEKAHSPLYEHRVAVASALADPALFAVPAGGWLADIALVAAVALGAVLRRVAKDGGAGSDPGDFSVSRKAAATSESVLARVRRLESAHDRVALASSRNARDLSKVSTRVRLVRRELSPALRKVEAESAAREAEAAALDARVRRLGDELRSSQRTVGALQGVTAKQFGALAKALTEVKGEIQSLARRASVPVDDARVDAEKREGRRETATATEAVEVDARSATTETAPPETVRNLDAAETRASEKVTAEPVADDETNAFDAGGNVMRVRRRRSLTFRVGGVAKKRTRGSAEGAAASAGDDADDADDADDDEAASEAP